MVQMWTFAALSSAMGAAPNGVWEVHAQGHQLLHTNLQTKFPFDQRRVVGCLIGRFFFSLFVAPGKPLLVLKALKENTLKHYKCCFHCLSVSLSMVASHILLFKWNKIIKSGPNWKLSANNDSDFGIRKWVLFSIFYHWSMSWGFLL